MLEVTEEADVGKGGKGVEGGSVGGAVPTRLLERSRRIDDDDDEDPEAVGLCNPDALPRRVALRGTTGNGDVTGPSESGLN